MSDKPKALVFLHGESMRALLGYLLPSCGYEIEYADSVDDMLEKMGIQEGSEPDRLPEKQFSRYILDVNDVKDGQTFSNAHRLYGHVESLHDENAAVGQGTKYVAVSALEGTVAKAKAECPGMPVMTKDNLASMLVAKQF